MDLVGIGDRRTVKATVVQIEGFRDCCSVSRTVVARIMGKTSVLHSDVCAFVRSENFSVDEKWTKNGTRNGRCGVEDCVFM